MSRFNIYIYNTYVSWNIYISKIAGLNCIDAEKYLHLKESYIQPLLKPWSYDEIQKFLTQHSMS